MTELRSTDKNFREKLRTYTSRPPFPPETEAVAQEVLNAIHTEGDCAVLKYLEKFDHVKFENIAQIRVSDAELKQAAHALPKKDKEALQRAIDAVSNFAREGLPNNWTYKPRNGVTLGERFAPMERVAVYIPGGTAPLVSTVIHTAAIAKVAGVSQIVAVTPPNREGNVNPYILAALRMVGVKEVYKMGGIYAIGALAYGTETIPKVEKIVGPGNAWVTAAKKLVYGEVSIDMIAGPSEVMVVADANANPAYAAADLLSQLEHGGGNLAILATNSEKLMGEVKTHMLQQIETLSRKEQLKEGMANGCIFILTQTLPEAATIASMIAPEHLELLCEHPENLLKYVSAAGAIFLGYTTPEPVGDFVAGPSHVLPTAGSARYFAGLSVESFIRRMSVIQYTPRALKTDLPAICAIADMEGLDAHRRSATIRMEKKS